MKSAPRPTRSLLTLLLVSLFATSCAPGAEQASQNAQPEQVPLQGWLAEVASKSCSNEQAILGAVGTERGPVLLIHHDWDHSDDDQLGYVAHGSPAFEQMIFGIDGEPHPTHVICSVGSSVRYGNAAQCPDGKPEYTLEFRGSLYEIVDTPGRFDRADESLVEPVRDGQDACMDRSEMRRSGAAFASGDDLNDLLCELYACVINALALAGQAGDERAGVCPFEAAEVASGLIEVDGEEVFTIVGADDRDLLDLGDLMPADDMSTTAVLCVFVASGDKVYGPGLPCGRYAASNLDNHTYLVFTQQITSRSTWVFEGDGPTPPPPLTSNFFGECPPLGTTYADPRTELPPVERGARPYKPMVVSTVDVALLTSLGPPAKAWNAIVGAGAPTESSCSALALMKPLTALSEEAELATIAGGTAPLIAGNGTRAATAYHALFGISLVATGIVDAESDPLIADWLQAIHVTIRDDVSSLLDPKHVIAPLDDEQATTLLAELPDRSARDLDIDANDPTARALAEMFGVSGDWLATSFAIQGANSDRLREYGVVRYDSNEEPEQRVRAAYEHQPDLASVHARAELLVDLHATHCGTAD